MSACAQFLVFGNEKVLLQLEQLLGIFYRQPFQSDLINQTEDRRIGTDAESQCKRGNYSEARSLPEHAKREAQVLEECFEKRKTAAVAVKFFRLFDTTKLDQRLTTRFCGAHVGAEIVFDVHLEMAVHLGREFAIKPVFVEQPGEPEEQRAQLSHADSFPGARNRAIIYVVCSHSRASFSNCLRPARVSLAYL